MINLSRNVANKELNMISIASKTVSNNKDTTQRITALIARVMQQSDDMVVVVEYCGNDGLITRRVVSPIRFVGEDRFLGLCLSREEPRQFYLNQCRNVRVDLAMNYTMPVELVCL